MHTVIKLFTLLSLLFNLHAEAYETKQPIDLSMVISGGVSLGAYEAGYNWAMVKMLSKIRDNSHKVEPKLRSVTGASAGSINALLTAIYWCQKPEIDELNTVDNNLFYNTWVDLGLSDLIITDRKSDNRSTLFTRDKLKIKSKAILELMKRPNFKEGCEVPLGFAVTKARPMITEFQKSGIKIKNQHFSIPLTLKTEKSQLMLENRKMPKSTDYYISIPDIEKNNEKVIDVLFASSAFPGAFKQIKLDYLYEGEAQSSYFIDGGAYDNLPLQLATELDREAKDFIFIDPSNIRKEKEQNSTQEVEKEPVGFLASNAIPLLDSLDIFQSMRLYNAITQYFGEGSGKQLILSSRYHPITGKFLGHFGAFLDKDFRIYDYHVGVYDAIYHLSKAMKERDKNLKISLKNLMMFQKKSLGIEKNPEALSAFNLFFTTEFSPNKPIIIKDKFSTIYTAFNKSLSDTERYNLTEFKSFLTKLNPSYLTDKNSFIPKEEMGIQNWYKEPLQLLINRITVLENSYADIEGNTKILANATNMVAWLSNNFVKKKNGFDFLPMNIPDHASNPILANTLRLLPNEITTDVKNGGVGIGYNIYSYQKEHNNYGFESKISFHQSDDIKNFIHLDMTLFQQKKDVMKFGIGGSLFGTFNSHLYNRESLYGLNAYIDVLDIFRVTYIHRYGEIEEKNFVYFGIENLPSLIYWLQR
jgi:predicted acylesterase/phospholipase RssA